MTKFLKNNENLSQRNLTLETQIIKLTEEIQSLRNNYMNHQLVIDYVERKSWIVLLRSRQVSSKFGVYKFLVSSEIL